MPRRRFGLFTAEMPVSVRTWGLSLACTHLRFLWAPDQGERIDALLLAVYNVFDASMMHPPAEAPEPSTQQLIFSGAFFWLPDVAFNHISGIDTLS